MKSIKEVIEKIQLINIWKRANEMNSYAFGKWFDKEVIKDLVKILQEQEVKTIDVLNEYKQAEIKRKMDNGIYGEIEIKISEPPKIQFESIEDEKDLLRDVKELFKEHKDFLESKKVKALDALKEYKQYSEIKINNGVNTKNIESKIEEAEILRCKLVCDSNNMCSFDAVAEIFEIYESAYKELKKKYNNK